MFHIKKYHNNMYKKKKQNNKVNKQKQYAFRCETCDKSFKDQKKYDEHMKSHVKCVHEGCSFSAPRQFMKHHELLHKNNMAKPLETPEEIAKYIEERKKRFPTRERIEQKKKEEEEKKKLMNDTDKISTKKKKPCIYFKKGNCRFGDECSFQHIKKRQRPNNFDDSDEDSEDFYPKSRNKLRKPKPVSSSKLIQNIVKTAEMKEIKAILQCIHFIVERNFLQGEN